MNELLELIEQDRKRIANDLHDMSLQNLTFVSHKIELASMLIEEDPIRAKLELLVLNKNLRSTINEIRNVVFGLHPMSIDDLGLKISLERLFSVTNEDFNYELDLQIEEIESDNKSLLVNIFRIVQECVFNIVKHAEANKIIFSCKKENDKCIIYLEDNGKGFDMSQLDKTNKLHFGTEMVKERVRDIGATIKVESAIDMGTKISLIVPLNQ